MRRSALLAAVLLVAIGGCKSGVGEDRRKPMEQQIGRDDAMRADQEMRDSTDALLRESRDR